MSDLGYSRVAKAGKCETGAEHDAGAIVHVVQVERFPNWEKALCGTKPGYSGGGWTQPSRPERMQQCERCVRKHNRLQMDRHLAEAEVPQA